jgi:hypothetical protein
LLSRSANQSVAAVVVVVATAAAVAGTLLPATSYPTAKLSSTADICRDFDVFGNKILSHNLISFKYFLIVKILIIYRINIIF